MCRTAICELNAIYLRLLMLAKFDQMKVKYTSTKYPGGHTWPVWRNILYNFAPLLFK
jgi:enterochelin esterase-like enzyme